MVFSFSFCDHHVSLQREATLHLVCDHFGNGEGGGGRRRGSVTHMEHPAAHVPDPAVKHKVVHEVSVSVQSLSSNSCRTPEEETNGYRKYYITSLHHIIYPLTPGNKHLTHILSCACIFRSCIIALPEHVTQRELGDVLLQDFNLCTNENPSVHFSNPVRHVPHYQLLKAPAE